MLAEGRYDAAREWFVKLTKDKELRRNSLRDVILSEIAIAHIDSEKDKGVPNPNAYNVPLKEMGIFNYESTDPPLLRLAQIRLALADRIYMNGDYYGLEMLALAMYARAYIEARNLPNNPEAASIVEKATKSFEVVAKTMDLRCFIFHTKEGFFKPVTDVAVQLGIVH